jgi:hypothetical protein
VADVMELARARRVGAAARVPPLGTHELAEGGLCPAAEEEGEYFVRVAAGSGADPAAVLIEALAARGARIETLVRSGAQEVVALSGPARRAELAAALEAPRIAAARILRVERDLG